MKARATAVGEEEDGDEHYTEDDYNYEQVVEEDESYYEEDDGVVYARTTQVHDDRDDAEVMKCCGTRNNNISKDIMDTLLACDTGCIGGGHVINDPALITKSHPDRRFRVQAFDSAEKVATQLGSVPGLGTSAVVPGSEQCLVNMRKLCEEIGGKYEGDQQQITIYDRDNHVYAVARDHGDGFLSFRYRDICQYEGVISVNAAKTVAQHIESTHKTAEEMMRAKEARDMCAMLMHPGHRSLVATLDAGAYPGCHLTGQDAENARDIYGKCLGCLEGKTIAPRPQPRRPRQRKRWEMLYTWICSAMMMDHPLVATMVRCTLWMKRVGTVSSLE